MATFVEDFVTNFHVFIDLSLVACSIVIRILKIDGLPVKSMKFEVDSSSEKSVILVGVNHSGDVRAVAFESKLTNRKLRKSICG